MGEGGGRGVRARRGWGVVLALGDARGGGVGGSPCVWVWGGLGGGWGGVGVVRGGGGVWVGGRGGGWGGNGRVFEGGRGYCWVRVGG